jgi:hypothetical protein
MRPYGFPDFVMETLEPDLRNFFHHEFGASSYGAYRLLPSAVSVRQKRAILIDIGAGPFHGSPKHLIDMYTAIGVHFAEVHLFESQFLPTDIPQRYAKAHNISAKQMPIRVGTRDLASDIFAWLPTVVSSSDFVVVKFDADGSTGGPTMEWGWLADAIATDSFHFIDELFIEMHFHFPEMGWKHPYHSMWQAFDVLRQLRSHGIVVHSWP